MNWQGAKPIKKQKSCACITATLLHDTLNGIAKTKCHCDVLTEAMHLPNRYSKNKVLLIWCCLLPCCYRVLNVCAPSNFFALCLNSVKVLI